MPYAADVISLAIIDTMMITLRFHFITYRFLRRFAISLLIIFRRCHAIITC